MQQKISPARIYLLLAIIVSVSAVLGFLLAVGKIGKINLPVITNPAVDPRCGQKVKFELQCPIARIVYGYEFNAESGKCAKINARGGCSFETPFKSMEECQKTCETSTGKELPFETILNGSNSNQVENKNYVIKNQSEWIPILQKINAELPAPIDFDKDMVIAVFQGEKSTGGYSIEINKIIETENSIEVSVLETSSGRGCMVTKAFTSPFHIIKVQKSDKEIIFKTEKIITDCHEGTALIEDICDIGKGDWGNGNGIFTGTNASLGAVKQKCEEKIDCSWKVLGGKITNNFACCPKDLANIITDENRKIYERCYIIID